MLSNALEAGLHDQRTLLPGRIEGHNFLIAQMGNAFQSDSQSIAIMKRTSETRLSSLTG